MAIAVGIDVAKQTHWAEIKLSEDGTVLVSRPVTTVLPRSAS